jgi:hypothetical protein
MTREEATLRVPDLVLERYRLGELPRADVEALELRLRVDAELRARLEALESSDAEIRHRYPPEWLAERIHRRLGSATRDAVKERPVRAMRWPVPVALAAAATVLLVLAPRLVSPPQVEPGARLPVVGESGDRIKGLAPSLQLFRKTPDGSEPLADGALARAGDVIRVGYRAAGRGFGVILSVDGRGAVTLHLPLRGDGAAALDSGGTVLLDHAYELDDAPHFERFYFVTAATPFPVATVVGAARRAGVEASELPLPKSLEQSKFLIQKGGRP